MTEKDETKPSSASKAPAPITPLPDRPMVLPSSAPIPPPKWDKWRRMQDVELWEAVALTVNLEPDEMPVYLRAHEVYQADPFITCPLDFRERVQIANSNAGAAFPVNPVHVLRARSLVNLPTFGVWAAGVWGALPHEFPIAALVVEPTHQDEAPSPKPKETTDQRCARLLRWFEEEEGQRERGALARVALRDGRARQTVKADIERAKRQRQEASNPISAMARNITL